MTDKRTEEAIAKLLSHDPAYVDQAKVAYINNMKREAAGQAVSKDHIQKNEAKKDGGRGR